MHSTAGLAVVLIKVAIIISGMERQLLMTGFAYKTLADKYTGRTMLPYLVI